MRLLRIPARVCAETASRLAILDGVSGTRQRWVPNSEQVQIWEALEAEDWVMAGKARRIGATTAVILYDVLWTALHDHLGSNVACGVVLQGDDETKKRVALAADMAAQLRSMGGADFTATTEKIVFKGSGAEIESITAGGKAVGRSSGYQRLHHSELPYWPSASTYASLMPTLALGGSCTIETTFDVGQPNGRQARDLWQANNRYHKLFFPMSSHESYRMPADSITEDTWENMQRMGWADREAAAWFCCVAVPDLCAGDVQKALREYPETPEHMFSSSAGRYIHATPQVSDPVATHRTSGLAGEIWVTEIWLPRPQTTGLVHIGVDTATGKGGDSSAVVVVDAKTGALAAAMTSNTIQIDDLAAVVKDMAAIYTIPEVTWNGERMESAQAPLPIVEDNGIGEATVQACARIGQPVQRLTTTEDTKADGLLEVKRAIEAGWYHGPKRLAEECDDLHIDDHGRFAGMKDLLMASGFALRARRQNPWVDPAIKWDAEDPRIIRHRARIRRELGSGQWR